MIVLMATLKTKPGKEDEFIANMKALVKAVRANEPGNLEYVLHRSQKDPSAFVVYEKYKSGEALQAHMAAPHFQEAAKKFPQLLEGGMGIETYTVVD